MNPQQIISSYDTLLNLADQMRIAADQGEWDHLIKLEQDFSYQIANIKMTAGDTNLDTSARQQVMQQITKILEEDAQIRTLTEEWMTQLRNAMQSNRQEQRLNQTYGAI